MSQEGVARWHEYMKKPSPDALDEMLADDVEFLSPIVFTPQKGKDLAKLYLMAAGGTFSEGSKDKMPGSSKSTFRYTKEVVDGNHAVLEFETSLQGKYVNGVDIITWNDAGKITEFKVMIRPLQAVNLMHEQMKAMLEKMTPAQ
ncbi:MAG: nuclear transport factor 2 family protein [Pseudomonadaceae bacterium]|nr:nuclear transport factor 2 family protein [Pseudomonadaceae bacterium]